MKAIKMNLCFLFSFLIMLLEIKGSQARIGHFWHVTDFHLDQNYTIGGDSNNMCWLLENQLEETRSSDGPAEFGDHSCDAPFVLVESAVEAMYQILPDPDFILWTGDDTTHVNDSFFSTDVVVDVIANITDVLMQKFPDTLVLPVLGNHDLYPQNQAPIGRSELQDQVADIWKQWLDPFDAFEAFRENGSYVADIPDSNISFVAFNTLLWYQSNKITADDPLAEDPAGQFAWADEVILDLENKGRKVYLMGHIPPGSFERYFDKREGFHWYQDRYNKQYINLINNHWTRISAQFYGHHHTDSFKVFLNEQSKTDPISYLLIAPAVSPMRSSLSETAGANNPGIRLVTYDTETGEVKEVSQYYLDLDKANADGFAQWELEYNLTDILAIDKIDATTLYDATLRLKDDSSFFDAYYPLNTVQWEEATACSEKCKSAQLCSITEIEYQDYYECNKGLRLYASVFGISTAVIILITFIYHY